MEDNIYLRKGVKVMNEVLVEEVKRILVELDIELFIFVEVREKFNFRNFYGKGDK